MIRTALLLTLCAATLGGCASSMSGIGGTDTYGCKAPEGSQCTSVSGVYANSQHAPTRSTIQARPPVSYGATSIAPPSATPHPATTSAVRSSPRVLRLWIAPWEDRDGDLHEASIVHVVVDTGRWLIEHVRAQRRSSLDAVAPPTDAPDAPAAQPAREPSAERERGSLPFNPPSTSERPTRPPQ